MAETKTDTVLLKISEKRPLLTKKGQLIGDYTLANPMKVVFMTTRELAEACGVSEATVIRFVSRLGYGGYSEFIQALRDFVDSKLTLIDRVDLSAHQDANVDRLHRLVSAEIDNLKQLLETMDPDTSDRVVKLLDKAEIIHIIGSRLSYMLAYFMGWALLKTRSNVHILNGSDSTTLDRLTIAPANNVVVIIATSRYPNELLKIGKLVKRLNQWLVVITDSELCPLLQFADEKIIVPSQHIPVIGNPNALSCMINYLVLELASRNGKQLRKHQEKLEQFFLENDILFNLHDETQT
jgi:DNA-binding MurR/RpiR family transcriptional regulator